MAPAPDEDLLAWAREVRGGEGLCADPSVLEDARAFLLSREAESARTATHTVLETYPDWWARGRRAPPGLEVERREDLEELYRHAAALLALGLPLTLAERRTPVFRLFQDVEAWGSREASTPAEELVGPDSALTRLLGATVGEVFPRHKGFLDVAVYDASGLSQTRGVRKTSLRLVWPAILVDTDRATRVRDLLVHRLAAASAEGGPLAELEARLRERGAANAWHSVFGDAAYSSRASVRMPLCDRVSPLPLRAPEKRPFTPVGVLRFSFGSDGKTKAEWLCQRAELEGAEWLKIGCVRQPPDAELTDWAVPAWPGSQPVPPSSTRTGRVKVRTAGGSDGGGGLRLRAGKTAPAPERAGVLITIERRLSGVADQFCEKMEQHLGKPSVEPDGAFIWRQPIGDARIVMHSEDQRIKIVGRQNQVRSLVVLVAPFTEALAGLGQGHADPAATPDGRAPSEAYAPAGAGAATEPEGQGGQGTELAADGASLVGQLRRARQDFEAQGQGELGLQLGETVSVVHDPEGGLGGSQDRWVYGRSSAVGRVGWFPLSHTAPLEDPQG